ncbi:MAG TPA: phosphoribosyltransferase family protein, partial [Nitrososphaera sp.]|nr:phosphoribosyltransferase family protein [Nitrososphaera sp.]
EGSVLCQPCRSDMKKAVARCYCCHKAAEGNFTCRACRRRSPLIRVQAAHRYEDKAKAVVWRLKFDRAKAAHADVAASMAPLFKELSAEVIITHIPTATSRIRRRGYDQASLIARACAQQARLSYTPLLLRQGQQRQVGAKRQERAQQLAQAFLPLRVSRITGAHIVLVDDVITTGATLEAAAKTLQAAGAKSVEAIVFAQA